MTKEAVGTGNTVDAAIEDGCRQLGMSRDDVKTEILNMPVKKTFGLFGGAPARVRVYVEETPAALAEAYLTGMLERMGLESPELASEEKENGVVFTLSGDDIGFLIGRRGETLDAIQYLTGLVANRNTESYYRITINSGNYREKREQTLTSLARRMAISAAKTGKNISLEPMNPYERRIIHTAVQGVWGATSWSEGDEAERHVIIGPDQTQPRREGGYSNQNRSRQGGNRSRGDGNRSRGEGQRRDNRSGSRSNAARTEQTNRQPGTHNEEKPEVPLYGRIEPRNNAGKTAE